jgi:DNA polymerase III delta prime subunit
MNFLQQLLWEEKYRPEKLDDVIISLNLKKYFKDMIDKKDIPNLLLIGYPGIGKTTIAKVIANELNADYLFINASIERGIDSLRSKVEDFVSTISMTEGIPKIVILDEADNMTSDALKGLRGFIENFSSNARFILTANYNRFMEAIISRFQVVNFKYTKEESIKIKKQFFKRLIKILESEKIDVTNGGLRILVEYINLKYPGLRKILVDLQKYVKSNGKVDENLLLGIDEKRIEEFYSILKSRDFSICRRWIMDNIGEDNEWLFKQLYDDIERIFDRKSIPDVILIIAEYEYRNHFVQSKEINTAAMCVLLMKSVFK